MNRRTALFPIAAAMAVGIDSLIDAPGHRGKPRQMKFGNPILSSELSGALGGVVAASARGGIGYFRVRRRPSNPRSQDQTEARNALTGAAAYWRTTLTDEQREDWEALSTGGKSGEALFIAPNALRIRAGQAVVADAPVSLAAVFTPPSAVTITSGDDELVVGGLTAGDPYNAVAGGAIHIFMTRAQRSSRLSRQFSFVHATSEIRAGAAIASVTVTVADFAGLEGITAGDIMYVRLITTTSDGRVSGEQIFRVVIVAP